MRTHSVSNSFNGITKIHFKIKLVLRSDDPGITRRDPRFIGAWWIGFTVIGIFLFFAALPMFLFPKQFKGANVKAKELKENLKGVKG